MVKCNISGDGIWSKKCNPYDEFFESARFIEPSSNNSYFLVGETGLKSENSNGVVVTKIDNAGEELWTKRVF